MSVELLYFDDCPNYESILPHLRELIQQAGVDFEPELRRVESEEEARRARFLGSPTVRVQERDVEPGAEAREGFGLQCRLYRTPEGMSGTPADEWILAALRSASPANSSRS